MTLKIVKDRLIRCFGIFSPEILRDPELFYIKSRDNEPRIRRFAFPFNQHNPFNPRLK
jgi:hypothetical protein